MIEQLTLFLLSLGSLLISLTIGKGTKVNALNLEARLAEEELRLIPLPRAGVRL